MALPWRGRKTRPVSNQKNANPVVIAPFFKLVDEVTMSAAAVEATSITVSDATNIIAGSHLILTDGTTGAFHICDVVGAPAGLVLTIDTPLSFPFGDGTFVTVGDHDLQLPVGTLADPIIYQVRVPVDKQSEVSFDVHRIMMNAITTGVGDLANFGDGAALVNGLVLRVKHEDGTYRIIGNAKTNGEMKGMMFDFDILSASNPQQGANGFAGRFSIDKLGGVVRLSKGRDLQILVQDDLTTRVLSLGLLGEGIIA
jgi:hypothetical protein